MTAEEYNVWASTKIWREEDLAGLELDWAGAPPGSRELSAMVRGFQETAGLKVDGKLGPTTWAALLEVNERGAMAKRGVMVGESRFDFPGPVIQRPFSRLRDRRRKPIQVVLHVDTTWDSERAYDILRRRGLSSHFGVDGDRGRGGYSTLYQWADPLAHRAAHAGRANALSIGVDVNTPLSRKYAKRDEKLRGRQRPVVDRVVRGKRRRNLGLFPEQEATLIALADLLEKALNIRKRWPRTEDGRIITDEWAGARSFNGWTGHHHHPTTHYCPGAAGVVFAERAFP